MNDLKYKSYKISEDIRRMIERDILWNYTAAGFGIGFLGGIAYALILYLI